jgi:RNA polymerase sigma-54 factor
MKQSLQLRVSQQLALTPQLQQSIRLLQLSTVELNQELERFMAENPLLEAGDAEPQANVRVAAAGERQEALAVSEPQGSGESTVGGSDGADSMPSSSHDFFEGGYASNRDNDDDERGERETNEVGPTLRDHLLAQVGSLNITQRDHALIEILIDSLNDDGYLSETLESVAGFLPAELDIDPVELSIALRRLQGLDPTGVGARSVAECLALQLKALPPDAGARDCAIKIVEQHIDALAARDFKSLKRALQCDEDQLKKAVTLVQGLNPRPGSAYSNFDTRHIIPDVIVRKSRNVWIASLNPAAMPRLRINSMYAQILQGQRNGGAGHLTQQLQEARWLIKNVQQRFETIQKVSQSIVDRQRHFFDHGEVAMRPLVLREIADLLGLHESTVSRVTTQKYMATPRGVFELKYFFGSHVATDTGGACSATAIRALLRQFIAAEDVRHPLSDSKIAEMLGQQGIVVARRTIAKYRESLQIPPVNLRKSL